MTQRVRSDRCEFRRQLSQLLGGADLFLLFGGAVRPPFRSLPQKIGSYEYGCRNIAFEKFGQRVVEDIVE